MVGFFQYFVGIWEGDNRVYCIQPQIMYIKDNENLCYEDVRGERVSINWNSEHRTLSFIDGKNKMTLALPASDAPEPMLRAQRDDGFRVILTKVCERTMQVNQYWHSSRITPAVILPNQPGESGLLMGPIMNPDTTMGSMSQHHEHAFNPQISMAVVDEHTKNAAQRFNAIGTPLLSYRRKRTFQEAFPHQQYMTSQLVSFDQQMATWCV